jgi:hypothetical protein
MLSITIKPICSVSFRLPFVTKPFWWVLYAECRYAKCKDAQNEWFKTCSILSVDSDKKFSQQYFLELPSRTDLSQPLKALTSIRWSDFEFPAIWQRCRSAKDSLPNGMTKGSLKLSALATVSTGSWCVKRLLCRYGNMLNKGTVTEVEQAVTLTS